LDNDDGYFLESNPVAAVRRCHRHTLFFLDLSLSGSVEGFAPPAPYTLSELDPAAVLPERVYTKAELEAYTEHCREIGDQSFDALSGTLLNLFNFNGPAAPRLLLDPATGEVVN
jgi:hypothetical protein